MDLDADEVAGVVNLFGALTREELQRALGELAFRAGADADEEDLAAVVDGAVASFALVPVEDRLVPGPAAFPTLPAGAEDLPHVLDVERRTVDREEAATAAERRFRAEAAEAADAGDQDRLRTLLDVSYELSAWGDADLADVRDAIDRALED